MKTALLFGWRVKVSRLDDSTCVYTLRTKSSQYRIVALLVTLLLIMSVVGSVTVKAAAVPPVFKVAGR